MNRVVLSNELLVELFDETGEDVDLGLGVNNRSVPGTTRDSHD